MPLVKCLTIILLGCLISVHCVPVSQSNDASQSGSVPNPEYGNGLGKDDMVPYPPSKPLRGRGVAIRPAYHRWAGGIVPNEFASNVSANNTLFIEQQMRTIESLTMVNNTQCVRFRLKNASDPYFLTIFNGSGCSAPVGSWGNYVGVRPVSLLAGLYSTCMVSGIVQHELTHALGFYHEQSRPDRDQYVSLQWSNINPAYVNNFIKYNDTDVDTQMSPYDYESVMHYDRNAFALNSSGPTIIPTMNSSAFIGQRVQLSPIDILEIQRYYGCVPTPNITNTTTTAATTVTTTVTSTTTTRTTTTTSATTTTTSATTATTSATTTTTTRTTTTTSATTASTQTSTTSVGTTITTTTMGSGSTSTTTQNVAKPSAGVSNALPSYFGMYLACFALILYL